MGTTNKHNRQPNPLSNFKMSNAELAVSYAALILANDGVDITADKLQTIIKAAKIDDVEPIWTSLFAKALEGKDVKDLLLTSDPVVEPLLPQLLVVPQVVRPLLRRPRRKKRKRPRRSQTRIWVSVFSTREVFSSFLFFQMHGHGFSLGATFGWSSRLS